MSEKTAQRIMKGGFSMSAVYLIGWISYGDVASTNMLLATFAVAVVVGIIVYIIDPPVQGM